MRHVLLKELPLIIKTKNKGSNRSKHCKKVLLNKPNNGGSPIQICDFSALDQTNEVDFCEAIFDKFYFRQQ